ncbi:MAG TPA: molybdopterin molybdotransferase MoeA [Syntrophomonadaceae bacterium]|nr:molybdopterin molybdotransferase MoeA [Syntrophomonadaceae bacterium]
MIYKEWNNINQTNLSLEKALEKISSHIKTMGKETVAINQAINRVAFQDIFAPIDVPAFPRSRVDGYAVNIEDCAGKFPLLLQKTGRVPAGDKNKHILSPGVTIKLMTGAPIPLNTGAVVKQEDTKEGQRDVEILFAPKANSYIEAKGDMIRKGQLLIEKGQAFTPLIIEQIANTGLDEVHIFAEPKSYLINSGSELQMPGSDIEFGEIHNSNQSMFLSLLELAGCHSIIGNGKLIDDIDLICAEVEKGLSLSDLIIITGGNAAGDWDLIPEALQKIGAKALVKGLDLRPGNKTIVANYGEKLIFNVSGNPHAGYILFNILIKPALKQMQGMAPLSNKWFDIKLENDNLTTKKVRYFCQGALISKNHELSALAFRKSEINYALLKKYKELKIISPIILDIPPKIGNKGDIVRGLLI